MVYIRYGYFVMLIKLLISTAAPENIYMMKRDQEPILWTYYWCIAIISPRNSIYIYIDYFFANINVDPFRIFMICAKRWMLLVIWHRRAKISYILRYIYIYIYDMKNSMFIQYHIQQRMLPQDAHKIYYT